MVWAIMVARNAPAMPSTVVRRNPLGLFGPGESSRAMMPATKPTIMIQRMPLMAVVLSLENACCPSEPACQFAFGRQASIRRQVVDHLGQLLTEAAKQFLARQAALRHQVVDLIGAECVGEIARRNLIVWTLAHP